MRDTTQKDYDALRRIHDATNETVRRLEEENAALRAEVALGEAQKRQWQVEREKQQQVIQQALERANATSNGYLQEVQRLRAELQAGRV